MYSKFFEKPLIIPLKLDKTNGTIKSFSSFPKDSKLKLTIKQCQLAQDI